MRGVVATDVVGREQELATVARLFDQRRPGPWVVIIEGDAGAGGPATRPPPEPIPQQPVHVHDRGIHAV
jgi:hypothetical protein